MSKHISVIITQLIFLGTTSRKLNINYFFILLALTITLRSAAVRELVSLSFTAKDCPLPSGCGLLMARMLVERMYLLAKKQCTYSNLT